ncbi:MAG: hypothetical protein V9G04_06800 [Nocardioides sp.]|jgi:hypothetical protein
MTRWVRMRGLWWSWPSALAAVVGSAWFANWVRDWAHDDHLGRVPAVVLGGLAVAVLLAPGAYVQHEVDGSAGRPSVRADLAVVVGGVVVCCLLAWALLPELALERGGLEMARNALGLSGLGLLCGAAVGPQLGWMLPFLWVSVSYLTVPREYDLHPHLAAPGWLMYPATWDVTWVVAFGLLTVGTLAHVWAGHPPRPRGHPLR